jgi:hypothetical protein
MPGLDVQLCILPVTDRLPARCKNFVEHFWIEELVCGAVWQAVNAGPESLIRFDCVRRVGWRDINSDRLRPRSRREYERQKKPESSCSVRAIA